MKKIVEIIISFCLLTCTIITVFPSQIVNADTNSNDYVITDLDLSSIGASNVELIYRDVSNVNSKIKVTKTC